MTGFDRIYVVLDALDECPQSENKRPALLNLLHDVRGWDASSLHMLVTSRREADIEDSFGYIGSFTGITVAGPQVEEDIKMYLRQSLQGNKFKKWKMSLRRDVEMTLASKADGM